MKEAAQLDEIRFAFRGIRLLDPIKICSHSVQGSGLGDRKKHGPLVNFRPKWAKIGHFSHRNEFLRLNGAAQLDEIRYACRGICLLVPIKIWSHSNKGSGRGGRKKRGCSFDFCLFF